MAMLLHLTDVFLLKFEFDSAQEVLYSLSADKIECLSYLEVPQLTNYLSLSTSTLDIAEGYVLGTSLRGVGLVQVAYLADDWNDDASRRSTGGGDGLVQHLFEPC